MFKFLFTLYENNKLPIIIIIFVIIYFIIYTRFIYINKSKNIKNNWYSIKNSPNSILLSPFIKNTNKTYLGSLSKNFIEYFTKIFRHLISLFLKPFYYLLNTINKSIINIKNTINKLRTSAQVLRELFKITVEKTANRINNSYSAIIYLQEKIKLLIKKQTAMFTLYKQFSLSLKLILSSFTNGPIPRIVKFLKYYAGLMFTFIGFCFVMFSWRSFYETCCLPYTCFMF